MFSGFKTYHELKEASMLLKDDDGGFKPFDRFRRDAAIHNESGKIRVTAKMKKFFWYKYGETKDEQWKWLALKKVGDVITIPERRFIGDAPEVKKIVEDIIKENVERAAKTVFKQK